MSNPRSFIQLAQAIGCGRPSTYAGLHFEPVPVLPNIPLTAEDDFTQEVVESLRQRRVRYLQDHHRSYSPNMVAWVLRDHARAIAVLRAPAQPGQPCGVEQAPFTEDLPYRTRMVHRQLLSALYQLAWKGEDALVNPVEY